MTEYQELLEIVRTVPEESYNQVLAEKKSWPLLYHLSHIRGNLVEWLPISGSQTVLEIGSECGALTGILAEKAGRVDCVEPSPEMNRVNRARNGGRGNVSVLEGCWKDVEAALGAYDWIILPGTLERAVEYAGEDFSCARFLRCAASHLKAGGTVAAAVQNRFGLKYFAGCAEDRTGLIFEGIEGFRNSGGVHAFSRPELEKLMDECGFIRREFYYPYPDYRFPMSIYSDGYLPGLGELRTNRNNYDRRRLLAFDESESFDSVIEGGLFPQLSNSFLVLMGREEPDA